MYYYMGLIWISSELRLNGGKDVEDFKKTKKKINGQAGNYRMPNEIIMQNGSFDLGSWHAIGIAVGSLNV